MKCNLMWTNKFSGETGFVGKVSKAKGYFMNAETQAEAKTYASEKAANKDIDVLTELGEAENNTFAVVEAQV